MPKIIIKNGLNKDFVFIDNNTILKIIRNYTKEAGVRELERQLDKIIRKIVVIVTFNV